MTADSIQRLQREAIPHGDPVRTAVAKPARAAKAATAAKRPPSRADKVAINFWTSEARRAALKAYAATESTTVDALMDEALENLFKLHGIKVKRMSWWLVHALASPAVFSCHSIPSLATSRETTSGSPSRSRSATESAVTEMRDEVP